MEEEAEEEGTGGEEEKGKQVEGREEEEWTWGNIPAGPPIMDRDQVCERLSPDTPGSAQK